MLMSQAAISAGPLCIDMFDLPIALDRPGRNAVVVLAWEARYGRDFRGLAAHGNDLGAGRLHVAGLVPGAALQYRGTTIPAPGRTKPGEGLTRHRLLQRRLRPALAAVG